MNYKNLSRFKIIFFILLTSNFYFAQSKNYDLTLVGVMRWAGGLTRIPISWIESLKDDLSINFASSEPHIDSTEFTPAAHKVAFDQNKTPGNVGLLVDHLWYLWTTPSSFMPDCKIKIAISMIEATKIPTQWVEILNKKFDAVIVPDPYYVEIYKSENVQIPIFVIPEGLFLDKFLAMPDRTKAHTPFTFGAFAALYPSKNLDTLITAFFQEFGNSSDFKLKIYGSTGPTEPFTNLKNQLGATNIEIVGRKLNQNEYMDFLSSVDCYVYLSKGEGYSLTPREAMAAGIPCVLSNNTAHKTLCDSGFVKSVKSEILEPADYRSCFGIYLGNRFNCTIQDASAALKEVFENYDQYLERAKHAREWVKEYDYKNLSAKRRNIVKPKRLILGECNMVTDAYLMTNSKKLYDKYQQILAEQLADKK